MGILNRMKRIAEGPLPPADRGVNDVRPGLPTPSARIDTLPNIAQGKTPTYAPVTNPQQLSPDSTWSKPGGVRIQKGPTGREYPVGGASSTQTRGFGKNTVSGTGLQDQRMVGVRLATPGPGTSTTPSTGKLAQLGRTTTVTPGFGKLSPSGTGISGQKERRRHEPQ
jgi:hypothetical protein